MCNRCGAFVTEPDHAEHCARRADPHEGAAKARAAMQQPTERTQRHEHYRIRRHRVQPSQPPAGPAAWRAYLVTRQEADEKAERQRAETARIGRRERYAVELVEEDE